MNPPNPNKSAGMSSELEGYTILIIKFLNIYLNWGCITCLKVYALIIKFNPIASLDISLNLLCLDIWYNFLLILWILFTII